MQDNKRSDKITIRFWFVYPIVGSKGIKRDGIGRVISSLINELLNRENITIELWCLKSSCKYIKRGFSDLISSKKVNKIKFQTGTCKSLVKRVNNIEDENAILLICAPFTLEFANITHKHKILICYDLLFYPQLFNIIGANGLLLQENISRKINEIADELFIVSHSKFVIETQVLKLTNVKPENTAYTYLPFIPSEKRTNLFDWIKLKFLLFKSFRKTPYIIYPTQIRPYKNVEVILKAMKILKERGILIKLLLTGKLSTFPPALDMAKNSNLMKDIVFKRNVSNNMLNLLYKNSAMCVAPSLAEGGMSWPIYEALANDTPAIAANMTATLERLESEGIKPKNSQLFLFDPYNAEILANHIEYVLNNRQEVLKKQEFLKAKLLDRTWKDVANDYIKVFTKVLKKGV